MSLPFVMPDLFQCSRRVLAHYFYPFPVSIDNKPPATDYYSTEYLTPGGENNSHLAYGGYLRSRPLPEPPVTPPENFKLINMQEEVRLAIARGITGFTFDILSFTDGMDPQGHLSLMLQAAQAVEPRFWIIPMLDMSAMSALTQSQAVSLIAQCDSSPSIARTPDGRMIFAAFNATQPLTFWQPIISQLNAQNVNVAFIPVLLGSATTCPLSSISIGCGGWGTATPAAAQGPASYMQPILTQQFRPKSQVFWECNGFDTFRAGFASAIRDGSQYCQIITWSDFSESGQVQPYTDSSLATNIGTGFYDLSAYYATWFATGTQPTITKDVIYWCYRKMASTDPHPAQVDQFKIVGGPETSFVEALAFLASPGTVVVNGTAIACGTGITSVKVPRTPGNPTIALQRNGSNVFKAMCPVTIGPSPIGVSDLTYWSGSLSN